MRTNAELYAQNFYAWSQETAALIAAGKEMSVHRGADPGPCLLS